jgi:hypothetical protein
VVRRILSSNKDELMPPPVANKPLSDEQKQILQRLDRRRRKYEQHWSFETPQQCSCRQSDSQTGRKRHRRTYPRAQKTSWLVPSPEADRYTLVRRASLDLLGLPPTPNKPTRL